MRGRPKKENPMNVYIGFYANQELNTIIEGFAEKYQITKSEVIRMALELLKKKEK